MIHTPIDDIYIYIYTYISSIIKSQTTNQFTSTSSVTTHLTSSRTYQIRTADVYPTSHMIKKSSTKLPSPPPPPYECSKIFNKNTVKVSNSCMPNLASIIKVHNNEVSSTCSQKPCNCQKRPLLIKQRMQHHLQHRSRKHEQK